MSYDLWVFSLLVLQGGKATFSELLELPSGGSPGVQHEYASNINKLRECWLRGRSALVYDGQVQAKLYKVVPLCSCIGSVE